jgi:hypothetical protein
MRGRPYLADEASWGPRKACERARAFEYHATWLAAPKRFSIDPALRLVTGPQFHRKAPGGSVFHAAIADTADARPSMRAAAWLAG